MSGTLTILNNQDDTDPNNGPAVYVNTDATVLFDGSQNLSGLDILPQGTARVLKDGDSILDTENLSVVSGSEAGDAGGVLDLADNDLIDQDSNDYPSIAGWLKAGYDAGKWDGESASGATAAAIVSSVAAADATQGILRGEF